MSETWNTSKFKPFLDFIISQVENSISHLMLWVAFKMKCTKNITLFAGYVVKVYIKHKFKV
jgi:hypothetical protein